MKTLITEIIDGYEVIKGFDRPVVDPVETRKNTEIILNQSPLIEQIDAALVEINAAGPDAENIQTLLANFKQLLLELEAQKKAIFEANLVYFEPKGGEVLVEDTEAATLKAQFDDLEDQALLRDGSVIHDKRNREYWQKGDVWELKKIETLGENVPADGIADPDLTEIQRDEIAQEKEDARFAALTTEEKAAEKIQKLDQALAEAAFMKSKLEITNDPDALTTSQAWYNAKVQEIEDKYS